MSEQNQPNSNNNPNEMAKMKKDILSLLGTKRTKEPNTENSQGNNSQINKLNNENTFPIDNESKISDLKTKINQEKNYKQEEIVDLTLEENDNDIVTEKSKRKISNFMKNSIESSIKTPANQILCNESNNINKEINLNNKIIERKLENENKFIETPTKEDKNINIINLYNTKENETSGKKEILMKNDEENKNLFDKSHEKLENQTLLDIDNVISTNTNINLTQSVEKGLFNKSQEKQLLVNNEIDINKINEKIESEIKNKQNETNVISLGFNLNLVKNLTVSQNDIFKLLNTSINKNVNKSNTSGMLNFDFQKYSFDSNKLFNPNNFNKVENFNNSINPPQTSYDGNFNQTPEKKENIDNNNNLNKISEENKIINENIIDKKDFFNINEENKNSITNQDNNIIQIKNSLENSDKNNDLEKKISDEKNFSRERIEEKETSNRNIGIKKLILDEIKMITETEDIKCISNKINTVISNIVTNPIQKQTVDENSKTEKINNIDIQNSSCNIFKLQTENIPLNQNETLINENNDTTNITKNNLDNRTIKKPVLNLSLVENKEINNDINIPVINQTKDLKKEIILPPHLKELNKNENLNISKIQINNNLIKENLLKTENDHKTSSNQNSKVTENEIKPEENKNTEIVNNKSNKVNNEENFNNINKNPENVNNKNTNLGNIQNNVNNPLPENLPKQSQIPDPAKKKITFAEAIEQIDKFSEIINNLELEIKDKYGINIPQFYYEDLLPDTIKIKLIEDFFNDKDIIELSKQVQQNLEEKK